MMTQRLLESRTRRGSESGEIEFVRVRLLGGFEVSVGSRKIEESRWRLRKAASLIKLLALARGHRLHRERIMDTLWPALDPRSQANNLHRALHFARGVLVGAASSGASRHLTLRDGVVSLCPDGQLRVDVEAFEDAAATARRGHERAAYRSAIELYAGEFLPEDGYEDWTLERRGQLRTTYLALLVELATLYEERGEYEAGIEVLRRALAEEPLDEATRAGLMRLYALRGGQREAIFQYEAFRGTLSRELGAEPGPAIRRLYEEIRAGRFPLAPPPSISQQPAGSGDSSPNNLPVSLTSFVGREHEMLEAKRLLSMSRLLTLTGAGGSGKTRLALEIASGLVGAYPDGVWLVELAPLSDPAQAPQAVAAVLDVPEHPNRPLGDTLAEHLGNKEVLLVLDNCEHLVDGAARLADALLGACPNLKILATSREPLDIPGEALWTVPPLSLPDADGVPTVEGLVRYEAARLLVDRARLRQPAFELTEGNVRAVAEVCRRLDGIPLAIELVTARMGSLSVEQIAERLEDSLKLLTGGPRTVDPRHQTMRATIAWTHDLLPEPEKELFARLSVFAGGWTLQAAEEVASVAGPHDTLELLTSLVDKSLVFVTRPGGEVRYRLLEPVRQYASARLESGGEERAVGERHALYFLDLAERAEPELSAAGQTAWLATLEGELDNLRAAMVRLRQSGQGEAHLRLAGALWRYCYLHGHYGEGLGWLEGALAAGDEAPPASRAKAHLGAGTLAFLQCEYDRARGRLEETLYLYRELGDERGVASVTQMLGSIAREKGDYARSEALHQESLTLYRSLEDEVGEARSLNYLAYVAWLQEKHEWASELCEETLLRFRGLGDNEVTAWALISMGSSAHYAGNPRRGRELLEESLALSGEFGYKEGVAWSLNQLGVLSYREGDHHRATELLRESLKIHLDLGDRWRTASVLEGLAEAYRALGQLGSAARLFGSAQTVREFIGVPVPLCERADLEESIAAARAGMGEKAFQAEWSEGRVIPPEQAIDYAPPLGEFVTTAASAPEQLPDPLTRRQREIAFLIARGLTDRQIAGELTISERTVTTHVGHILKKLGVNSRAQVASWIAQQRPHSGEDAA